MPGNRKFRKIQIKCSAHAARLPSPRKGCLVSGSKRKDMYSGDGVLDQTGHEPKNIPEWFSLWRFKPDDVKPVAFAKLCSSVYVGVTCARALELSIRSEEARTLENISEILSLRCVFLHYLLTNSRSLIVSFWPFHDPCSVVFPVRSH